MTKRTVSIGPNQFDNFEPIRTNDGLKIFETLEHTLEEFNLLKSGIVGVLEVAGSIPAPVIVELL